MMNMARMDHIKATVTHHEPSFPWKGPNTFFDLGEILDFIIVLLVKICSHVQEIYLFS